MEFIGRTSLYRNTIFYGGVVLIILIVFGLDYERAILRHTLMGAFVGVAISMIILTSKRYYVKVNFNDTGMIFSFEKNNIFYRKPIEIPYSSIKSCSLAFPVDISAIGIKCFSGRYIQFYFDNRVKNDKGTHAGDDMIKAFVDHIEKYNRNNVADRIVIKPPFYASDVGKYFFIGVAILFAVSLIVRTAYIGFSSKGLGAVGLSTVVFARIVAVYYSTKQKYEALTNGE
jgi:hypothetical protein